MNRSDDVLARILAGELDPTSAEARDAAANDPDLRASLADIVALESGLASLADEHRANSAGPVEGEEAALDGFRAQARRSAPPRRSFLSFALLAAAAVVAVALGLHFGAGGREPVAPPRQLGVGGCGTPEGAVARYDVFTWSLPLPPNGTFDLEIRDAEGQSLLRVSDLEAPRHEFDAETAARFPARIRWRVTSSDGTGVIGACEGEAWLESSSPR